MNVLILLTCAGFALSVFMGLALLAAPRRAEGGKFYLSLVCVDAAMFFLKDLLVDWAGPAKLIAFLGFYNFLFGLPGLYLFVRSTFGEPVSRPLRHFIPALANLPCAFFFAVAFSGGMGRYGSIPSGPALSISKIAVIVYIHLLNAGETLQLIFYGSAGLRLLQRDKGPERSYRNIVLACIVCYACYYVVSWIGLEAQFRGTMRGTIVSAPDWVSPARNTIVAIFVSLVGLYVVTKPELLLGLWIPDPGSRYGGRPLERKKAEDIVLRASQFLATCADLSEENVDPRRLAVLLGVPYYLLSRAVNEYSGKTLADLIRERRVERAKSLLTSKPGATILEVALDAGFSAKSSFNEAFKKTVGMSPTEYRKQVDRQMLNRSHRKQTTK